MGCKTCKPEELGNLGGIGKSTPSGKKPGADWAKGKGENGTGGLLMIYADNLYIKLNKIQTEDLSIGDITFEVVESTLLEVDTLGVITPKSVRNCKSKNNRCN